MKRAKRQNVKKENPEASSSQFRDEEEHDLAYYIHDRVELVHQVFSVLKYKDLKALAPECVRHISIDDLQELCTEELLGISSKRLCAILDGAEPPSDTESSSRSPSPPLETISLDSISSDEEILSQTSKKKKKHKHRRRDSSHSKAKSRRKKSKDSQSEDVEKSKASRAGLTVLELLELQARARAIRAQLQQEQAAKQISATAVRDSSHQSSEDEVEIKEEPADVVEISSEDEKPNIDKIQTEHPQSPVKQNSPTKQPSPVKLPTAQPEETATVTKPTNEIVITVPQAKPTRKIKLNRNNVTVSVTNVTDKARNVAIIEHSRTATIVSSEPVIVAEKTLSSVVDKVKPKIKRKKKDKKAECVEEDHDEITLQLSDSEKMDLLQDLDRKALENVSSSEDSESSSESDSESDGRSSKSMPLNADTAPKNNLNNDFQSGDIKSDFTEKEQVIENVQQISILDITTKTADKGKDNVIIHDRNVQNCTEIRDCIHDLTQDLQSSGVLEMEANAQETEPEKGTLTTANMNEQVIAEIPHEKSKDLSPKSNSKSTVDAEDNFNNGSDESKTSSCKDPTDKSLDGTGNNSENVLEISTIEDIPLIVEKSDPKKSGCSPYTVKHDNNCEAEIEKQMHGATIKASESNISEGEISDRRSSEIEMSELKAQVVCISDEESSSKKKKKKKDKKSKKVKSKKSKSNFRESADENFYKEVDNENENRKCLDREMEDLKINARGTVDIEGQFIYIHDDDDIYEILEISDDSSCYEVEGTVLSKEPTTDEILALSAKIDEIEREEDGTEERIAVHDIMLEDRESNGDNVENVSWKDRYLGSKKVKKVLTTSNILNALRKRNKELKKKLEDSKKTEEIVPPPLETPVEKLEEGTIEHYNMLQGSTTFVDPVKEPGQKEMENKEQSGNGAETGEQSEKPDDQNAEIGVIGEPMEQTEESITKEMRKDAKQLLKMYKRLLKYNDNSKQKDPNKKKKKNKQKKPKNKS